MFKVQLEMPGALWVGPSCTRRWAVSVFPGYGFRTPALLLLGTQRGVAARSSVPMHKARGLKCPLGDETDQPQWGGGVREQTVLALPAKSS